MVDKEFGDDVVQGLTKTTEAEIGLNSKLNKELLEPGLNIEPKNTMKYNDNKKGGKRSKIVNGFYNHFIDIKSGGNIKNSKTVDNMLNEFIRFTNKYSSIKKYKKKFNLKFLNKKFKNFNPKYFQELCNNCNKDKEIIIDFEDELVKDYLDNYKSLKEFYITNCEKLLEILDTEILEIEKQGEIEIYQFKNIDEKNMNDVEKKVRTLLGQIYFNCQKKYIYGIKKLDKYFIEK